ncbi:hypothetical protein [Streptomyces sp. NPDC021224]|uniref:hypothetical protein n=1 Tax=unclassified Streptomyces TaxID=2593676 RepID=UPI0037B256B1
MNRTARARTVVARTLPLLLTLPLLSLLAALGAVPWDVLLAVPIALAVQAAATFVRLRPRRVTARDGR